MEELFTLAEARQELTRRRCAAGGHSPTLAVRTLSDLIGTWVCDCGQVRWEPVRKKADD